MSIIGKMMNNHHQSKPANDTKNIAVTIATSKYSVLVRRFIRNDCFMLMIIQLNVDRSSMHGSDSNGLTAQLYLA